MLKFNYIIFGRLLFICYTDISGSKSPKNFEKIEGSSIKEIMRTFGLHWKSGHF